MKDSVVEGISEIEREYLSRIEGLQNAYYQKAQETKQKQEELVRLCKQCDEMRAQAEETQRMRATISWRVTKPLRFMTALARRGFRKTSVETPAEVSDFKYPDFISNGTKILKAQQNEFSKAKIEEQIADLPEKPLFSIVLFGHNEESLIKVIKSLQQQYYRNLETIVIAGNDIEVNKAEPISQGLDISFIPVSEKIEYAQLLEMVFSSIKGECLLFLDNNSTLFPDALFWGAKAINESPQAVMVYSDSCRCFSKVFKDFFFKPDWSPHLFEECFYIADFLLLKGSVVREAISDHNEKIESAYELADILSKIGEVAHISRTLCKIEGEFPSAQKASKTTITTAHTDELSELVSIIIPSDNEENIIESLRKLDEKTAYPQYEIILVSNSELINRIENNPDIPKSRLRYCHYDLPFNFSDKCNKGAQIAKGEYLIFYNDDVYPDETDWIEKLVTMLKRPEIGSVSPLCHFPDGRIQYAGMKSGISVFIEANFPEYPMEKTNYGIFNHGLTRDVSILNGACFGISKNVFNSVGMFDSIHTPNGHSDVDLAFRLMENGFYNVFTPKIRVTHKGIGSWKGLDSKRSDKRECYLINQWGTYVTRDCFFTPQMCAYYYTEYSYYFQCYFPEGFRVCENSLGDVLFVSHDMQFTGAPLILLEAAKTAKQIGYNPVIYGYCEGQLRDECIKAGMPVIIDESFHRAPKLTADFIRNFDRIFVNSVSWHFISIITEYKIDIPVDWWIHEGQSLALFKDVFPWKLPNNIKVHCVSQYSKEQLRLVRRNYKSDIFPLGLEDIWCDSAKSRQTKSNGTKRFALVGLQQPRKGTDLLIEAIKTLERDVLEQSEFYFVGDSFSDNYYALSMAQNDYPNIKIKSVMPREEVIEFMSTLTALIIPSRDEPLSMVGLEAMMNEVPVIFSDAVGLSYHVHHGKDGMIFHNEDIVALAELISYSVQNTEILKEMGRRGRRIYEKYYTHELFRNNLQKILAGKSLDVIFDEIPQKKCLIPEEKRVLVSVIVPVYNTDEYLEECLDSIVNQTYTNLEIICVNDGSTDNSSAILEKYEKRDERIRVITQSNAGPSAARNNGLENMTGEYFCFVDSDDYLAFDIIEEAVWALLRTGSDLISFDHAKFDSNGCYPETSSDNELLVLSPEEAFVLFFETHPYLSVWGRLFNKRVLGTRRFLKEIDIGEDVIFFSQSLAASVQITSVNRIGYFYRQRGGSLTKNLKNEKFYIDHLAFFELVMIVAKSISVRCENSVRRLRNRNMKDLLRAFFVCYRDLQNFKLCKMEFKKHLDYFFDNPLIGQRDRIKLQVLLKSRTAFKIGQKLIGATHGHF